MFGWRRRKDGFEWREYVRTTILLRRKNRRDKLVRAGGAAVEGLKAAGEHGAAAGVVGAQALGRGAKAAGQQGLAMGAAGVQAAESGLRAGLPRVWAFLKALAQGAGAALLVAWRGLRAFAGRMAQVLTPILAAAGAAVLSAIVWGFRVLGRGLASAFAAARIASEPLLAKLRQPSIGLPLAVAGSVALLGAVARLATKGLDRDTFIALLIGLVIVGALLVARYSDAAPPWLAHLVLGARSVLGRLADRFGKLGPFGAKVLRPVALLAALALVVGAGWLAWRAVPVSFSLADLTPSGTTIKGRAAAVSGDTLRIKRTMIRLSGIEAPVYGQTCRSARSRRRRRCDAAARAALSRLVGGKHVTCEISGTDGRGRRLGTCRRNETDIAAELVRNGYVFAETGFFAAYASLEREAQKAKVGIWRGETERPSDYRAQKWEEAKRDAPDGCPIKGNVRRGRRIYVLPWTRGYERVRISRRRGERWFCSEAEARAAGWKPSGQS